MHTNAGMVTALQQAVAHLSSAVETVADIQGAIARVRAHKQLANGCTRDALLIIAGGERTNT